MLIKAKNQPDAELARQEALLEESRKRKKFLETQEDSQDRYDELQELDEEDEVLEVEFEREVRTFHLPDGVYSGVVQDFYHYQTDSGDKRWFLAIGLDDEDETLFQCTFPQTFNPEYGFGKAVFAVKQKHGKVEKSHIVGRRVKFTIKNKTKNNVTYSNIVDCCFVKHKRQEAK